MSRRPSGWSALALAAAMGALAGVLIALGLGGGTSAHVETITVPAPPPQEPSLVSRTAVPALVGRPLGVARDELSSAGFTAQVDGASLLGLLLDRGWTVSAQTPAPGVILPTGATVVLVVTRR